MSQSKHNWTGGYCDRLTQFVIDCRNARRRQKDRAKLRNTQFDQAMARRRGVLAAVAAGVKLPGPMKAAEATAEGAAETSVRA